MLSFSVSQFSLPPPLPSFFLGVIWCVCMCEYMLVSAYSGATEDIRSLLYHSLPYFLKTGSLTEPEVHCFGWLSPEL